jgi:hypothetical protein
MKNPLRTEADAFRFVFLAIGYFALIVLASWINTWLGLAVFVVLTVVAVWLFRGGRREAPPRQHVEHAGGENERRILVIANETVAGTALRELLQRRAEGVREEVLVVCPALNSPLRHWVSDEDGAREAAQQRLGDCLARLSELGVEARGEIGDGDPLQAIEDALRTFPADEIIVSTHPEGRSNWLERGVVAGARERFDVPVTHVVTDLEAEAAEVGAAVRDPAVG